MGQFRRRVKGKGLRWKKGQSSSSNPSTTKHRDAAKSRFFKENLGEPSLLTTEALQKHNAIIGSSKISKMVVDEEEEGNDDVTSIAASTANTTDTFATDYSGCSNVSYSKFLTKFNPNSAIMKERLAVLAAVAEVIKSNGGTESNTEYFAALMTMLENGELEDMSLSAVVSLINLGIRGVPKAVLQLRFSQCTEVFLAVLAKYSESQNNVILMSVLSCLSVLLRSQELSAWKDSSTTRLFQTLLLFTVHSKPKIRKAAQHGVCALIRARPETPDDVNIQVQHPAVAIAADFCVNQIEKCGSTSSTSTLHILGLMKDIIMTFPKKKLKAACESILKVMTLGNVVILSCGMQALHGLFISRPPETVLSSELNAQLINALYEYQPPSTDSQPTQAWLAVMQEATINLSRLNLSLCVNNFTRLLVIAEALWLTDKPDVMNAATLTIKACLEDCLNAAAAPDVVHNYPTQISKVIELLRAGLGYQYHAVWPHVLHLLGVLFKAIGETCGQMLLPVLKELADLRDSFKFTYMNELDYCIGNAVRSMGPKLVLQAIPLRFTEQDANYQFKRSWMLPILKDNIQKSTLQFFTRYFLPLAVMSGKKSEELSKSNDKVGSVSYELLQSQIWALLPSFCSKPSDIATHFSGMAKTLGGFLTTKKDLRTIVMSSLRKLILWCNETKNLEDTKEIVRFAKNYLPILFNIYTTKANGSTEEGTRLAALETICVYLTIADSDLCKDLFRKAMEKLEKATDFTKESVLDLIKVLIPYQPAEFISEIYGIISKIDQTQNHTIQKKYYRILEGICKCEGEGCRQFLNDRITDIQNLLLDSLSSSAPSTKSARISCLIHLIEYYGDAPEELIIQTVPEAILACQDVNTRCRALSYELVVKMAEQMSQKGKFSDYVDMVLSGLAGHTRLISATLLALASIVHNYRDQINEEVISMAVDNVLLLLTVPTREIVGSALHFIKVYITSFDHDVIAAHLKQVMFALGGMTEDCKRHFRMKVRGILNCFVRWFGWEIIYNFIPKEDKNLKLRVRNLNKQIERKKKKQETVKANKNAADDVVLYVKKQPKSIDEILAESDSDFDEDEECKVKFDEKSNKKKKSRSEAWLQEKDDDFVDFTVPSNKKITVTRPESREDALLQDGLKKKKQIKTDSEFKLAPDGRLIIRDIGKEVEDDQKVYKFGAVGLSDSDDYEEDDDDAMSMSENKSRKSASTKLSGRSRKRKLSISTDGANEPPMKYQAGGSGIHRPIKPIKDRKGKKKDPKQKLAFSGDVYRAKKSGGDIKRKGLPDPYAYLPLQKKMLNKRKKMKAAGQFKNIVKHAKKGAKIGRINKLKFKK